MNSKFTKYIVYALFAIAIVVLVAMFFMPEKAADTAGPFLIYAGALLLLSLLLVIILPVVKSFSNPKGMRKMLISIGIMAVLFIAAYLLSSSDSVANVSAKADPAQWKMTDTGLIATYVLFCASVCAIVYGSIANLVKKYK